MYCPNKNNGNITKNHSIECDQLWEKGPCMHLPVGLGILSYVAYYNKCMEYNSVL